VEGALKVGAACGILDMQADTLVADIFVDAFLQSRRLAAASCHSLQLPVDNKQEVTAWLDGRILVAESEVEVACLSEALVITLPLEYLEGQHSS
jgi:anti-sigma factor RsiW